MSIDKQTAAMHAASAAAGTIRALLSDVAPGGLSTDMRLVAEAMCDAIDALWAASETVASPLADAKRSRATRQPVKAQQPFT